MLAVRGCQLRGKGRTYVEDARLRVCGFSVVDFLAVRGCQLRGKGRTFVEDARLSVGVLARQHLAVGV